MNDLTTVIISLIGSFVTSFLVAKYYGERWVETRRSRKEHSEKLVEDFFKPWSEKVEDYCKVDALYSNEANKMLELEPQEPIDLQFYDEAKSHLDNYGHLINEWKNLKQITLKLNKELTTFFEELGVLTKREIDVPYYCWGYSGDQPDEYLCPDTYIGSIYEEVKGRLKTGKKRFMGNGEVIPTIQGEKKIYELRYPAKTLAKSLDEELIKKTQRLFIQLIEAEENIERIKDFVDKQKETYDKELEKVKQDIQEIITSVELGNIIKGKCRYCP